MKRILTALLLVLTLTLALSGCTRKDNGSNDNPNNSQNGTPNNGGTANNGGTMNDGATDNSGTSDLPSGASRYGSGYGYDAYAQPGSNGSTSSDSADDFITGRSYDEMLRNGRVRDTDGILADGENSTSRW